MGRYLVSIFWSEIYMLIVGFIAAPLTQNAFNLGEAAVLGVVFGILFAAIIPPITSHSVKDDSEYSKLK
ncbi:YjzD family protein [Lactobacillus sp. ESL0684]|uniref:YjzD family protein n=1 Tax=unclassified Lactobacillus TaxID=2620435 RepID=UPI0023F6F24C|nr:MULTISPECIES: YjzD family protein [unclassified Lactobacillus]WEV40634.1 YjzD family protein [Lactobacillus sp. ESL0681]WEV42846.1 YjzD family protein [Lactobacillus sp. ESL0684]